MDLYIAWHPPWCHLVCDVTEHFLFPGNTEECLALVIQYFYRFIYASVNSSWAQSPPPLPFRATAGHLPSLSVPGEGHLRILHFPGAGHLPTPGPLASFWRARSFLSEYNYTEGFTGKTQISSPVKDRNKLKRVVKACSRFYAYISSLLFKPELHSENWSYQCESTCFGFWISADIIWRTSFHIYIIIHNI